MDNILHFGVGLLIVLFMLAKGFKPSAVVIAALLIAVGKETYDWLFKEPDLYDTLTDIFFTILPALCTTALVDINKNSK